jgi:hypothetical protein
MTDSESHLSSPLNISLSLAAIVTQNLGRKVTAGSRTAVRIQRQKKGYNYHAVAQFSR